VAGRQNHTVDDAYEEQNDKTVVSGNINEDSHVTKGRASISVQGD
jgi:hypothetical protein